MPGIVAMTRTDTRHLLAAPSNISWKRALGISCASVYGPFVVTALYTFFFVPCSHCKLSVWTLLPWGPGLVAVELARLVSNASRPPDAVTFALSFIATMLFVAALAFFIRLGKCATRIGIVIALVVFSICALATLSMIRA